MVSTAYFALLPAATSLLDPGQKYSKAAWFDVRGLPPLAYDHDLIARAALERLRAKIQYTNVAYGLLGRSFTLGELQHVYEVIRGRRSIGAISARRSSTPVCCGPWVKCVAARTVPPRCTHSASGAWSVCEAKPNRKVIARA